MSSGTSKIVESIMSEAQEKADLIIQDANAEVSAIQAKAEKSAEAEKTKILENGKKQSDMRYQQIISEAVGGSLNYPTGFACRMSQWDRLTRDGWKDGRRFKMLPVSILRLAGKTLSLR